MYNNDMDSAKWHALFLALCDELKSINDSLKEMNQNIISTNCHLYAITCTLRGDQAARR